MDDKGFADLTENIREADKIKSSYRDIYLC
jgi:hypothetical protein